MSNTLTIEGLLGGDLQLRYSPQGKAFGNGSVADTPRRFNRDTNQWEDAGETLWQKFVIFGADAERAAEVLRKGQKVTISGKLRATSWDDKSTGEKRFGTELAVNTWYVHIPREQGQVQQQAQQDPWGSDSQQSNSQGGGFGGGIDDSNPPF